MRKILEDREDFKGREVSKELVEEDSCVLWFAGKEMFRDQVLEKFVGKNEKAKIKIKITGVSAQVFVMEGRKEYQVTRFLYSESKVHRSVNKV